MAIKSTEWLYGTNNVPKIPNTVIKDRVAILNERLREVNDEHYTKRDDVLKEAIIKAIKFWETINDK